MSLTPLKVRPNFNKELWTCVGGILIGAVFLRSGLFHISNPYLFLSAIYDYELVGMLVGEAIAILLPFAELLLAMCLICRVMFRASLLLGGMLLTIFSIAQLAALCRGLRIACGCFQSQENDVITISSLAFTIALSIVAVACCFWSLRSQDGVM